ncbi:ribulose-5-phosphate 4-epimerase/fuculose-1-phosphate aldolase [Azospirillum agricola]|uniref:class II aldolase/adducin family protein n=1 Tax=Azospirillum agricola TaxID=1720247 RepID=UPI001AE1D51E|nr:class II aldolase/adducin family protein [Azospirillum agricola]MBP2231888.1 ribulose-5-phosphate 4-epimerase/fuculose-1-phosphate aldolase [Azospirillum agricola]
MTLVTRIDRPGAAPPPGVSDGEWAARLDLAAAYRLAGRFGWHDLLGNHLSVRVPGTADQYLVNPWGFFFEEITASTLVKVDIRGNVLSDSPHGLNPAADVIHAAVYAARPDIASVMHLHSVAGTGVASQTGGLLPISQSALLIMHRVRYHDFEGAAIDPGERARLVEALGDGSVLFLRNHGTLTAGRTLGEAFALLARVERACAIQLAAQSGGAINPLPDAVIARTIAQGRAIYRDDGPSPGAQVEWAAFRRKIDREDPGYAQ